MNKREIIACLAGVAILSSDAVTAKEVSVEIDELLFANKTHNGTNKAIGDAIGGGEGGIGLARIMGSDGVKRFSGSLNDRRKIASYIIDKVKKMV